MKSIFKLFFYKLYRFAVLEEKSVSLNLNFVILATAFEILHLLVISLIFKILFGFTLELNTEFVSILLVVSGILFNYFYFIKNKKIQKLYFYYQNQERNIWKSNLFLFGYILFLFIILFFQVSILKRSS